jgi:hypothetical protein
LEDYNLSDKVTKEKLAVMPDKTRYALAYDNAVHTK